MPDKTPDQTVFNGDHLGNAHFIISYQNQYTCILIETETETKTETTTETETETETVQVSEITASGLRKKLFFFNNM